MKHTSGQTAVEFFYAVNITNSIHFHCVGLETEISETHSSDTICTVKDLQD